MRELGFVKAVTALENAAGLDGLVTRVQSFWESAIRPQPVRDVLHGVPIGHPVHPLAVQVPVGAWTSAAVLDLIPGTAKPTSVLVAIGLAGAAPSVLTGWTDWTRLHEQQMRVGLVHAAANAVAVSLYSVSLIQRLRGKSLSGKVLAYAGFVVVSGSGYLGGHLAYRQAAGANHAEHVPHLFPQGWQPLGPLEGLDEGVPTRIDVAGQPLLAVRSGTEVDVLSNVCSHLSAPLDEGPVTGAGTPDACITCPWHDSVFSLRTGEVVHGPATSPQPRFDTRIRDGFIEVQLQGAG